MCHLMLLMPVLGIVVFWIWPLVISLPVYLIILSLSMWIYIYLMKAIHNPILTGKEGLINEIGEITDMKNHRGHVSIHGEIWNVETESILKKGDLVNVIGVNGLTLKVQKVK